MTPTTTTTDPLWLALCLECGCGRWVSDAAAVDRWQHCHCHAELGAA